MKVLVLGGTGRIGKPTSERVAKLAAVTRVTVAGRNRSEGARVASQIGSKATSAPVDLFDHDRLVSLASQNDLVVNTAGPDYKVADRVVRAAVDAGVHCIDISADPRATERILALDEKARASGLTIITGIGHSPGISNLMMMHAARQLDEVEEVHFDVNCPVSLFLSGDPGQMAAEFRKSGSVNASWETLFKWIAGPVRILFDGRLAEIDPAGSPREVNVPTGGITSVYPLGTTEPVTMPSHLRGIRSLSSRLAWFPPQLNVPYVTLGRQIRDGELDTAEATISFLDLIAANPRRWLTGPPGAPSRFINWATAMGWKGGRQATYTCWPLGDWMSTVGTLFLAVSRFVNGDFRERGVFPPEGAFEAAPFLREVARDAGGIASRRKWLAERLDARPGRPRRGAQSRTGPRRARTR